MDTSTIVFLVYLMGIVDSLSTFLASLAAISIVLMLLASIPVFVEADEETKVKYTSFLKKAVPFALFLAFIAAILPSKETAKDMVIAYGASEILQSQTAKDVAKRISDIAGKTATVVEKKLDKAIAEQ